MTSGPLGISWKSRVFASQAVADEAKIIVATDETEQANEMRQAVPMMGTGIREDEASSDPLPGTGLARSLALPSEFRASTPWRGAEDHSPR